MLLIETSPNPTGINSSTPSEKFTRSQYRIKTGIKLLIVMKKRLETG
jgi:hypothetical protein